MQIRLATDQDAKRWDTFVEAHQGGPYLYFAWKKAIENSYGHKSYYLLVEEGEKLKGIFPVFHFKMPFFKGSLVSLPFCDYGGPLAESEDISLALLKEAERLASRLGLSSWEWRFKTQPSFFPEPKDPPSKVRLLLKLPPSADELWKALKSKVRSQVRRPMKEGAEAVIGGLELVPAFYHIYQENMHYLGSPPHSLKWFKEVIKNFSDQARVVVVYKENCPLAAGIILLSSDTVTVPWAASRRAYKRISPNMLLYWKFLNFAADHGFKYFDFGRSTPGSGTYRFKKQWGAEPIPLFWYQKAGEVSSGSSRFRALVENVWRRLPSWAVNWLGPKLRGYISL